MAELPLFAPTYDMQQSTIAMPCNHSGMMDMTGDIGKFGIVDYDWNNGKSIWASKDPFTTEELLITQAILRKNQICPEACPLPDGCPNKTACPQGKTWIYRNFVKAFPWYTTVREKVQDPQYSGWFLKFNPKNTTPYNVPVCDDLFDPPKCTDLYHNKDHSTEHGMQCVDNPCDCGNIPCGEYIYDHRNGSMLQDWLVEVYAGGATGLANPNVDGFFIDDTWSKAGPAESDPATLRDIGLSTQDVADIQKGWEENMAKVKQAILKTNGFNWQMFDVGHRTNAEAPFAKEDCTNYMRTTGCTGSLTNQSLFYGYTDQHVNLTEIPYFEQDLAAFLSIRGPYAWLGYSWIGCNEFPVTPKSDIVYHFPPALSEDYGEPLGLCAETSEGSEIFVRKWSKATVTLDCKNWQGSIDMTKN